MKLIKAIKEIMWVKPDKNSEYFEERHPNVPLVLSVISLAAAIIPSILEGKI